MPITYPCIGGESRCLCQTCIKNAGYEKCNEGYCIDCLECEHEGRMVHDVWWCSGYKNVEDEE